MVLSIPHFLDRALLSFIWPFLRLWKAFRVSTVSISIIKRAYLHSSEMKLVNKGIAWVDQFTGVFLQRTNRCISIWWRHSGKTFHPTECAKVTPCTLTWPKLPTILPSLLSVASGCKRPGQRLTQFWGGKNLAQMIQTAVMAGFQLLRIKVVQKRAAGFNYNCTQCPIVFS